MVKCPFCPYPHRSDSSTFLQHLPSALSQLRRTAGWPWLAAAAWLALVLRWHGCAAGPIGAAWVHDRGRGGATGAGAAKVSMV